MVETKFSFYNVYKIIYKNINKSVFFYEFDTVTTIDYEFEIYMRNVRLFLTNYFGIFYIMSVNFVKYTDWFIFKTTREKALYTCVNFKTKKIFYNTLVESNINNINNNCYLTCL